MANSLFQGKSELSPEMEQDVRHTYHLITSSRYVTNRHLEQISMDAKKRITQMNCDQQWLCLLIYLDGVFSLSIHKNDLEYERRFSHFFQAMIESLTDIHDSISHEEYEQYTEHVLRLLIKDAKIAEAPWSGLLFRMVKYMKAKQIESVYTSLSKSIDPSVCSRNLVLAFTYIALLVEKEVTALSILTNHKGTYEEHELNIHFQLLKERSRWRTMKQWVSVLFPKRHNRPYGSLQPFIDEMNTALPSRKADHSSTWNRWVRSPNYERYLMFVQHISTEEQQELIERLLPQLEQELHQPETAKTYEKLLLKYEKCEIASRYLLDHERDPLRMRQETNDLLQALKENEPMLARPIYHQFVIRLVEKKSRLHYKQAAMYIKILQSLYEDANDHVLFNDYISKLKKMYRTYRAFIEELKRIDL